MRVLWERGECAVSDLLSAIVEATPLAYTSVLTTVRILEKKGYVTHRQVGRAFYYKPLVAQIEASRSEVRHVLQRFFGDSRERLLLSVLGDDSMTAEELQRIRAHINEATDKSQAAGAMRRGGVR